MTAVWMSLVRVSALVAMSASAALFMHYVDPIEASFCAVESGCEAVRRSPISYFFLPFLNMPLVGLVGFGTLFVLSLGRSKRVLPLAVAAGAIGVALIGAQALWVGEYCWLCLIVDVAAAACALFALLEARSGREASGDGTEAPRDPLRRGAWYTLAAIAVAAPPIWGVVRPAPPVPSSIRELYVPGKVNVVEFADFECPFCRLLHPVMKSVLSRYPAERIHFVRMNFPLPPDVHPNALPAARAHVCAETQGKGEALADMLFRIDLEPRAIRRAVATTSLDMRAFDACIADPKTDARIEEQKKRLKDAGMQGLPTTYIGGERLVGLVDEPDLIDAIESAARDESGHGVPTPLYLALVSALVAVVVWLGRARVPRTAEAHR